jgi:hypothetical protein
MWLLQACSVTPVGPADRTPAADTSAAVDTTGDTGDTAPVDSDTTDASPYVGELLDPPLDPPSFAVYDQGGALRTEADLVGHPTVLWFFREAEGAT